MKKIPLHSLVLMVGPSGAGKTTVTQNKFETYEVVSSDAVRTELVGDVSRYDINDIVFREVHRRTAVKLELGERVVIDATNLRKKDRIGITETGLRLGVPVFYVVVNRSLDDKIATAGNTSHGAIRKSDEVFKSNEREILRGDNVANVIDARRDDFEAIKKLSVDDVVGDIVARGFKGITVLGDVHGMVESLRSAVDWANARNHFMLFLGDILDYGPNPLQCVDIVYEVVKRGRGFLIRGNHERKIERWLDQVKHGEVRLKLSEGNKATTLQIEALGVDDRRKFEAKYKALMGHARDHLAISDDLLCAHGAAEPEMFNIKSSRLTGRFETIAMFGEVDPKDQFKEDGYPNRIYSWVDRIPNGKCVMVGHDIRSTTKPLVVKGANGGKAVFMDTGSGKGGRLTTADLTFKDNTLEIQNFTFH